MNERKTFLLRIDAGMFEQLRAWAADEMRSVNGQVEYILREALRQAGRLKAAGESIEGLKDSEEEKQ